MPAFELHGAVDTIAGTSASFTGGSYAGVWGPVVERAGMLFVHVLLFADLTPEQLAEQDPDSIWPDDPRDFITPALALQYKHDGQWHDCEWLGTGGASPNHDYLDLWTQWQAPDVRPREYRLSITERAAT